MTCIVHKIAIGYEVTYAIIHHDKFKDARSDSHIGALVIRLRPKPEHTFN